MSGFPLDLWHSIHGLRGCPLFYFAPGLAQLCPACPPWCLGLLTFLEKRGCTAKGAQAGKDWPWPPWLSFSLNSSRSLVAEDWVSLSATSTNLPDPPTQAEADSVSCAGRGAMHVCVCACALEGCRLPNWKDRAWPTVAKSCLEMEQDRRKPAMLPPCPGPPAHPHLHPGHSSPGSGCPGEV